MPLRVNHKLREKVARVGQVKTVSQTAPVVASLALKVWCAEAVRAGMLCNAPARNGYAQLVRRLSSPLDYFTPLLLRYLEAHPSHSPVAAVVARYPRLDKVDSAVVAMAPAQARKYDISHMKALEDHMEGRVARDLGTYALVRQGVVVAMWALADVGKEALRADGIVVMPSAHLSNQRLYDAACDWLLWWSREHGRAVLYAEEHLYDDALRATLRTRGLLPPPERC